MQFSMSLWLCTQPADMRKSFNGLIALVKNHLKGDPCSGQGFVFINKNRTLLKCLYFEPGGYCIWRKRLEQGQFALSGHHQVTKIALTQTEFSALVEGIDMAIIKRRKRYQKAE